MFIFLNLFYLYFDISYQIPYKNLCLSFKFSNGNYYKLISKQKETDSVHNLFQIKYFLVKILIKSNNQLKKIIMDKLFLSSNIFASQYQVKDVHLLDNSSILYETVHNYNAHIVHQVSIFSHELNSSESIIQLLQNYCRAPYIKKVFIDSSSQINSEIKFDSVIQLLKTSGLLKLRIVLSESVSFEPSESRKKQDFISLLNQFLQFLRNLHQQQLKCPQSIQNLLILKDTTKQLTIFYPLAVNKFENKNQSCSNTLHILTRQYLLTFVSKNLKDFLYLKQKPNDHLLQLYEDKYSFTEFKQFIELLRETSQNKDKFTQKMLICYIEILKEKYLQNKQTEGIHQVLESHKLTCQKPQRDNDYSCFYERREKSSNSFTNFFQTKSKSLSRKLKIEKQPNSTGEKFRHSEGKKSSSMIPMSPNRKNRKYLKYSTTVLFPSSKQTFQRTSSASFLVKKTQSLHQNTRNCLINEISQQVVKKFHSTNNEFSKIKNVSNPSVTESQKKSYLQTIGFGNKENQQIKQSHSNSKNSNFIRQETTQSNNFGKKSVVARKNQHSLTTYGQNNFSRFKIFADSSRIQNVKNQGKKFNNQSSENPDFEAFMKNTIVSDAEEKKLRLKQSLSLFERKKNNQTINPIKQYTLDNRQHDLSSKQFLHNNKNDLISISSEPKDQNLNKFKENEEPKDIKIKQHDKFQIFQQSQMNLKIRFKQNPKVLRLDRSTVMVMHIVSNSQKQKQREYLKNTSVENQVSLQEKANKVQEISERKQQKQVSLKPSLANVKKQRTIQKKQENKKLNQMNLLNKNSTEKNSERTKQVIKRQEQNLSAQVTKKTLKKEKLLNSAIEPSEQIQTQNLPKTNLSSSQLQKNSANTISLTNFPLSKQFLKQIFLFINSENKALVDLLGSKLSYQITFYAFYINYFKLNVIKATTRQTIQKMSAQMKDYETKIRESQKLNSAQKMLPEFEPFVKKLLKIEMKIFIEQYWKKEELGNSEKEAIKKLSQDINELTSSILKVSLKVIMNRLNLYTANQKQTSFAIKGLKISTTISQLIHCIFNGFISMTAAELKKIVQAASLGEFGFEKKWIEDLSKLQGLIDSYDELLKLSQNNSGLKVNVKSQTKMIQSLTENL